MPQMAFQSSFVDGDSGSEVLLINMPAPTGQGTTSQGASLQRLALDQTFGWGLSASAMRRVQGAQRPVPQKLTSSNVPDAARRTLREMSFKLQSSGVSGAPSGTSSLPRPSPGFAHGAFTAPFDEAVGGVDVLLAAVRRSRDWGPDRLQALCMERDAWTASWPELREVLVALFGPAQQADFVVQTVSPIGRTIAVPKLREEVFNANLDSHLIPAVNAILVLIGISGGLGDPMAPQSSASAGNKDDDDDDVAAAEILVAAAAAYTKHQYLRLVAPEDKDLFLESLAPALTSVRPEWVLVSGPPGSHVIHGVIEGKPFASREALQELAARRDEPLTAAHVDEPTVAAMGSSSSVSQPIAATRQSARLASQPRPRYDEAREKSKDAERAESVERNPQRPSDYGYVTIRDWQKLLLQLSSQLVIFGVRHALVWGGWSSSLVAVELQAEGSAAVEHGDEPSSPSSSSSSQRQRSFALSFASCALDAPVVTATGSLDQQPQSASDPPGSSAQPLTFASQPNVVMALVQWVVYAHRKQTEQSHLLDAQSGLPTAIVSEDMDVEGETEGPSAPATAERKGDKQVRRRMNPRGSGLDEKQRHNVDEGALGPSPSTPEQGKTHGKALLDAPATPSAPSSSSSSSRSSSSSSSSSSLGPARSPLPLSPSSHASRGVRRTAGGPLPSSHVSPPTSPDERKAPAPRSTATKAQARPSMRVELLPFARGAFANVHRGVRSLPGQPDQAIVYKVNRLAEGESDSEDGRRGVERRVEKELRNLRALHHLQGTLLPVLYGTSSAARALALPKGAAKALILEDVGRPIDSWRAWPTSMPLTERRRLVEEAFATLHAQGVCHHDVAPRNVCVSFNPASSSSSSARSSDATPSVRVCLVDLTEALTSGSQGIQQEVGDVRRMLDYLFGPSAAAATP